MRGLEPVGRVQVPQKVWDLLWQYKWRQAHEGVAVQPAGCGVLLRAMVRRICEDGLLDKINDGRKPHARAFMKAKWDENRSLIINMVPPNERCAGTKERLKLPTREDLGEEFTWAARNCAVL